jgi:hypothetical protein
MAEARIQSALSFIASTLTAEHMISAGMSSPWSVAKFAKTQKDKDQVWQLFTEAIIVSAGISILTAWMLGGGEAYLWAIGGVIVIGFYVGSEYERAMKGTL